MSKRQRAPFLAFCVVAVLCGVVMVAAARAQGVRPPAGADTAPRAVAGALFVRLPADRQPAGAVRTVGSDVPARPDVAGGLATSAGSPHVFVLAATDMSWPAAASSSGIGLGASAAESPDRPGSSASACLGRGPGPAGAPSEPGRGSSAGADDLMLPAIPELPDSPVVPDLPGTVECR